MASAVKQRFLQEGFEGRGQLGSRSAGQLPGQSSYRGR